jgi:hypothetical protein
MLARPLATETDHIPIPGTDLLVRILDAVSASCPSLSSYSSALLNSNSLLLAISQSTTYNSSDVIAESLHYTCSFVFYACIQTMNIGKAGNPVISAKWHGYGSGAILMYDTTRRESFMKCPDWIDAFKNYASNQAVLLLLADRSHESSERKRAVSGEDVST